MLVGQQLRRGHEGGLAAVLPGQPGAGRRHHRLAGANVPLEQAVHGGGLFQIRPRLLHGPALGPGEGEGQPGGEGPQVLFRKGRRPLSLPPPPDAGEAQGQAEEFLKHQPPPGPGQGRPVRGEVDVVIGLLDGDQVVLPAQVLRQSLLHLGQAGQGGPHQPREETVADPRGEGVDGEDPPGEGVGPLPLEGGVDHLAVPPRPGDFAVKDITLPRPQGPLDVVLVEKGEVHLAGGVHHPAFGELHPPPNPAGAEGLGHHGGEAHRLLQGEGGDALLEGAVLILPGEIGQKVPHGGQAQLGQGLGPGLAHPGQGGEGGMQGELHGGNLLSKGVAFCHCTTIRPRFPLTRRTAAP